jgi:hypothetical protein
VDASEDSTIYENRHYKGYENLLTHLSVQRHRISHFHTRTSYLFPYLQKCMIQLASCRTSGPKRNILSFLHEIDMNLSLSINLLLYPSLFDLFRINRLQCDDRLVDFRNCEVHVPKLIFPRGYPISCRSALSLRFSLRPYRIICIYGIMT